MKTQTIVSKKQNFLEQVDKAALRTLAQNTHSDICDIYMQDKDVLSVSLEESVISVSQGYDKGTGVRQVIGSQTGFAYTESLLLPDIENAFEQAKLISAYAKMAGGEKSVYLPSLLERKIYLPLVDREVDELVSLLGYLDKVARRDPRVEQVNASIIISKEKVAIFNDLGQVVCEERPLTRMNVDILLKQGEKRGKGYYGFGGRSVNFDTSLVDEAVAEALRISEVDLEAKPAIGGELPVVLGNGWTGVLLHEAVGHGLEADFNRKGTSIYSDKMGQMVASSLCTIVDAGNIEGRRGSLDYDDEGTRTSRNVLIEKGRLVGLMYDRLNAMLMGKAPTGNGRRQDYKHLPLPRMTNTFMLAGESSVDEMISSIDKGIYATNFSGGQVDIVSGDFVFTTSEAYYVEKGKIIHPVKNATLIGNGPEIMKRVSMVGNDFSLDKGVGTCGKDGQGVPVGVGQPSLKIEKIVVGGASGQ